MTVSIIIVAYKGEARLIKCLESIKAFKGRDFHYQVIVVDNDIKGNQGSGLESRFPDFYFIRNETNGGFANGNNLGAKNASGEFLLILNPDTVVTEAGIEAMVKLGLAEPRYSIISCRQLNQSGKETKVTGDFPTLCNLTGFQRSLKKIFASESSKETPQDHLSFPDWVSGSVILIRRRLYEELKGFFEGFWMYYEDVDLCKRVADQGGKVVLNRDIMVEHNHGGSSRTDLRTTALTKTEVRISQHLYIARNMKGIERFMSHSFLVVNNLITGTVLALAGIVLFFLPVVFVRTMIFARLVSYYSGALFRGSWISPRSVLSGH